jgi:hypothetical protein
MSTTPLHPHPQDALAGHHAGSGSGGIQKAASGQHGEQRLIGLGYVPVRQLTGKVLGVWGEAHIRLLDGEVRPLHVGDIVKKGEVVLTAQDGIVQLESAHPQFAMNEDVERLISQVGQGDADVVPAAGPNSGGANGSLEEGLRVERDIESLVPPTLGSGPLAATTPAEQQAVAQQPQSTAPTANPDAETTTAGTPVTFDPRANDSSATQITIVAVAGHAITADTPVVLPQGTVTLNPDGSLTFTPNAGFSGSLTFTYTDQNAGGASATSSVTVDVTAVDHAPVAVADTFSGHEDVAISGNLSTNDTPSADGGNTWSLASGAAHGTVTVNADGTFTYMPTAHYSGADSFTYTITDADGSTSTATVTLDLAASPVAGADSFTGPENTALTGTLAGNDTPSADGSSVWSLTTGAAHGTVVVNADGTYTYTPAAGYTGTDSFTYTITDAAGTTSTASVTLTVTPIAPTAVADSASGDENATITGSLATNDTPVAGESNTWTVATDPAHGSVVVNADGTYAYTPDTGYVGKDSFTYTITDAHGQTSTATATITVEAISPTAAADAFTVDENGTLATSSVLTNDTQVAGDASSLAATSTTAHGTLTLAADFATTGNFTYTPDTGYVGKDSFTYTITDAHGQTSTATATITVEAISPTAAADAFTVDENGTLATSSVLTNDTQVAGDASSLTATSTTSHGTLTLAADFATTGNFTYTPDTGYVGKDSFTYTITDAHGQTSTATATITVEAISPTAAADTYTTTEDTAIVSASVRTNDVAVAGETNDWALVTSTSHGTLTLAADFATTGKFTYTPDANYSGADSFTYTITDDTGRTATATATIDVTAVADAPTLAIGDKTYYAATDFEETGTTAEWADISATKLGSGSGATTATNAGTWQTDNVGGTVEIGTGGTYGIVTSSGATDTSHVIELEQNANDRSNLTTTMETKAGELYTLDFDFAARSSNSSSSVIYVYWEGQLVATLDSTSSTLTHYTLELVATTTGSSTLEFVSGDSNSFGGVLDNITLGLQHNTAVQGYIVALPTISAARTDTDGSESITAVTISGIPVGATLTDGVLLADGTYAHTFTATSTSTTADITTWNQSTLELIPSSSNEFTGSVTLGVHATSTESSNGSSATTDATVTVSVTADTSNVYGSTADDTLSITDASDSSTAIRWGLDGNDSITGSIGHDTLLGGAGNDTLVAGSGATLLDGGTGNDVLIAGTGADTLSGGAGNDTMTAGTSSVTDVFKWHLGDGGTEGTPAHDTIIGFDSSAATSGGDVLDLRDLLVGELASNTTAGTTGALTNYLDFDTTTTPGSTIIHISTTGDFSTGYSSSHEDQTITLNGVDLRASMGLSSTSTDAQVISELLNRGKLITDGQG